MTVQEAGWKGVNNGRLLALAGALFDAFMTNDHGIPAQQNRAVLPLPVIALRARRGRMQDIRPLVAELRSLLNQKLRRRVYRVPE